jgi:hypothetical protein
MKVDTDLKSGSVVSDVTNFVSQGINQAADFVATADQQAGEITSNLYNTAQSVWNSLTGWLSF